MTAFSKTIVVSISLFGYAPPSLWNQYNWGSFKWGEGTNTTPRTISHVYTNSLGSDSTVVNSVSKLIDNSLGSDSTVAKDTGRTIAIGTLGVNVDMAGEALADSEGYAHIFPDRTAQGESRSFETWADAADPSDTWASAAVSSTFWS